MQIPFWKMQTIGNDFVLVHQDDLNGFPQDELAKKLCSRRYSIGSDGLLVLRSDTEKLIVNFYNPDGSEDFCGNGLRCAALHCVEQGWLTKSFWVEQLGFRAPVVENDGLVTAVMPWATMDPSRVPIRTADEWWEKELHGQVGSAVSTASTHFVILCDELPDDLLFETVSSKIEIDPLFPERTSVIWAVPQSSNVLKIRIWERAIGETLGCGTGASAAAAIWSRKSGETGTIHVRSKGGSLDVTLKEWNGPLSVSSRPETVYQGTVEI